MLVDADSFPHIQSSITLKSYFLGVSGRSDHIKLKTAYFGGFINIPIQLIILFILQKFNEKKKKKNYYSTEHGFQVAIHKQTDRHTHPHTHKKTT